MQRSERPEQSGNFKTVSRRDGNPVWRIRNKESQAESWNRKKHESLILAQDERWRRA